MDEAVKNDLGLFAYVISRLKSPYWTKNWGTVEGPKAIEALTTIVENEQDLLLKP